MKIILLAFILATSEFVFVASAADAPSVDAIRAAIAKALPLLEVGAKGSMVKRARNA